MEKQTTEKHASTLRSKAQIAVRQKEHVLKKETETGGYFPVLHDVYREKLPELVEKYDGMTGRDALILYMYLHSYANGTKENDYYMWAFPTVEQIRKQTGIHRDRINKLSDILVSEGLLITVKIPWNGHTKKMYLPLYYDRENIPFSYEQERINSHEQDLTASHS